MCLHSHHTKMEQLFKINKRKSYSLVGLDKNIAPSPFTNDFRSPQKVGSHSNTDIQFKGRRGSSMTNQSPK